MKLSLEQYLRCVDFEIESGLAARLSGQEKKERLWAVIGTEEERVAGLRKDFDYGFVLTRCRVLALTWCGLVISGGFKVEGELERKREAKRFNVLTRLFRFCPFFNNHSV